MTIISPILGTVVLILLCVLGFMIAETAGWLEKFSPKIKNVKDESSDTHAPEKELAVRDIEAFEEKAQGTDIAPTSQWYRSPAILTLIGVSAIVWLIGDIFGDDLGAIQTVLDAILLASMTLLCMIDLRSRKVPNKLLLVMLGIWLAGLGIHVLINRMGALEQLLRGVAGMIVGGAIFLLCYLFSRRQLGGGDVKLAFVMGLYLTGTRILGAVFYGVMLAFVFALVQLCRRRVGLKDGIPLVPFLYAGILIIYLLQIL